MTTQTINLGLTKPSEEEAYDVNVQNINMDLIDQAVTEKVSKSEIPTSLPANGGNADTVDNKHASDFATVSHTHTKSDVGLGNVDNTADANKRVNYADSAGSATKVGGYAVSIVTSLPLTPDSSTIYFVKG